MKIFGSSARMNFMNKDNRRIENFWRIVLFSLVLTSLFACKKADVSDSYDVLDFSDDTTKAAELVADANEDLNKIKIMYKKNEAQLDELQTAVKDKDIAKVKTIAENLGYIINDGTRLGQSALEKIESAEAMDVNADFKDYLDLKAQSLQKQLDAFEHRRQAALLLRDSFGTNNPAAIEKARNGFKEQEEVAQKILATAKELSEKANTLAKETSKKTVN